MKRRKRIISIALVCSMLFGIPVMAAEEDIENDYDVEATSSEWLKSVDAKKMEPIYLSPEEIEELYTDDGIEPQVTVPDDFEPNNTPQTAYPYDQVPVLQSELTNKYDLYYLGMRSAGLHSPSDEDWYTIDLTAGEEYFVDLRNVGNTNWYIEVYNWEVAEPYRYSTNPEKKPIYEKNRRNISILKQKTQGHFISE